MGVENKQLECVTSIYYLVKFEKGQTAVQALLESSSEVNVMTTAYTALMGLRYCLTDIRAQKIGGFTLSTHDMILANF